MGAHLPLDVDMLRNSRLPQREIFVTTLRTLLGILVQLNVGQRSTLAAIGAVRLLPQEVRAFCQGKSLLKDFGGHKWSHAFSCFPPSLDGHQPPSPWPHAIVALSDWGNTVYTAVIQMFAMGKLSQAAMQNQEKVGDLL